MSAPGSQSPTSPSHRRSSFVQNDALKTVITHDGDGSSGSPSGSSRSTVSSELGRHPVESRSARSPTSPRASGAGHLGAVSADTTDGLFGGDQEDGNITSESGINDVHESINVDLVEKTGPKSAISVSGNNPIVLQTKSFKLTRFPDRLFQYSVVYPKIKIKGRDIKSARVEKEIFHKLLNHKDFADFHSHIATDGKTRVFSAVSLLPQGKTEKSVSVDIDSVHGSVIPTIKTESIINFTDPGQDKYGRVKLCFSEGLHALNAVFQRFEFPSLEKWLPIGGGKYFEKLQPTDEQQRAANLGYGLHPRNGFLVSVQDHSEGVLLNLSVATTVFYNQGKMIDFLEKWFAGSDLRELNRQQLSELKALLTGLQVRYCYKPPDPKSLRSKDHAQDSSGSQGTECSDDRARRINGFGISATEQIFKHDHLHVSMSVQQWFDNYVLPENKRLAYPELPVVNTGSRERPVWIPLEVLQIEPHQPVLCNLRRNRVKAVKMFIARKTEKDVAKILQSAEEVLKLQSLKDTFNIELKPCTRQIQGHILRQPSLQEAEANCGLQQKTNSRTKLKLLVVHYSTSNAAMIPQDKGTRTQTFLNSLTTKLSRLGTLPEVSVSDRIDEVNEKSLETACLYFLDRKQETGVQRVILVVTGNDDNIGYAKIKHWSDCKAGVLTVCVVDDPKQPRRFTKPKYISSVAQKIVLKLEKQKRAIQCLDKIHRDHRCVTMVVGVGFTVSAGQTTDSSLCVMGVVATTDYEVTEYQSSLRLLQLPDPEDRKKINEGFEHIMHEQLVAWHGKQGTLPKNILLYRAGVGEAQHVRIKNEELRSLSRAFERAKTTCESHSAAPNVTFVVVETNHKKRFDLTEREQEKHQDVKTGFSVRATGIKKPVGTEFYLQELTVTGERQRTARQGHYHVLENGMQLPKDVIEGVTYALCAANVNPGARTSYVVPAYYANKLCKRGQLYLKAMSVREKDAWLARGSPWKGKVLEGTFFYL